MSSSSSSTTSPASQQLDKQVAVESAQLVADYNVSGRTSGGKAADYLTADRDTNGGYYSIDSKRQANYSTYNDQTVQQHQHQQLDQYSSANQSIHLQQQQQPQQFQQQPHQLSTEVAGQQQQQPQQHQLTGAVAASSAVDSMSTMATMNDDKGNYYRHFYLGSNHPVSLIQHLGF